MSSGGVLASVSAHEEQLSAVRTSWSRTSKMAVERALDEAGGTPRRWLMLRGLGWASCVPPAG